MARINILKRIKVGDGWKMVSIPRHRNGNFNWKALGEGRYFIEWYEAGNRRRESGGVTAAQAQEKARIKKRELEAKALGLKPYSEAEEKSRRTPLHVAVKRYLDVVEGLKKPNTLRKYKAVLERFLEFFSGKTAQSITADDLNEFMVFLKKRRTWATIQLFTT